jgi:phage/plasmid-associated DNA primase
MDLESARKPGKRKRNVAQEDWEGWLEILRKPYSSDEETEFELKEIARSLEGTNKEEIMKLIIGGGGNGKGFREKFVHKVFGDYCETIANSCVIKSKNTVRNGHDISLYTARKARRWIVSELEEHDVLDTGELKKFSGGDLIPIRTHNQKTMEFITAPPVTCTSNYVLKIKNANQRWFVRRFYCLHLRNRFLNQEDFDKLKEKEKKDCFVLDNTLKDKLEKPRVKCILMNILIHYYKKYLKDGLKPPQSIIDSSKYYRENTSTATIWFNENLERTAEGNLHKESFRMYFMDHVGRKISKSAFKKLLAANGFTVANSVGVLVCKKKDDASGEWYQQSGKKGMCVLGVKLKEKLTMMHLD